MILSFSHYNPRNGYTHAVRIHLESKDALRVYQDHPLHVKVKDELIAPILDGPTLAIDWEIEK